LKSFGQEAKKAGAKYRKGAYCLVERDGEVAIVKNDVGYFLLGGGHEMLESDRDCIVREAREEAGMGISILEFLERVEEYVYVKEWDILYLKDMFFYRGSLGEEIGGKTEDDHELMWVKPQFAIDNMYLKGQSYIIEKYASRS